jgi:hypothetical protein
VTAADHANTAFAALEHKAAKPAEELLDGFLIALGDVDTEMLEAIADYRDAIHPHGWMQTCIREYLDVWR